MKNALLAAVLLLCHQAVANDDIINYFHYSPTFASSGQPTAEQLKRLRDDGLKRIVYIAYSDHERSLANEDRIAKRLGMEYIHIPVEWSAPTVSDFELFASVMQQDASKSTLLHCQMNFRATAFAMMYRVIHEDVPVAKAKAEMNAVWTPNETWTKLIFDVLQAANIDPHCDGCDWTPAKPQH
ncbi:MAG: protein tyrosine phosphatase family protein [Gammaproteobacteria bacterium]